jgi:hypothetical protein
MNLTVGPLPPAVYWRRRAFVLGAILVAVLALVYSCGGSGPSSAAGGAPQGHRSPSPSPSLTTSTTPASDFSAAPAVDSTPSQAPVQQPVVTTPPAGPCADNDIALTVAIQGLSVGYYVTLRVKNASAKACTRDVGADQQEMHAVNSRGQIVWSSDYCQTVHGPDVRTFAPNVQDDFRIYWDGHAYATGCVKQAALTAGSYLVIGKLGTKLSVPVPFTVGT